MADRVKVSIQLPNQFLSQIPSNAPPMTLELENGDIVTDICFDTIDGSGHLTFRGVLTTADDKN